MDIYRLCQATFNLFRVLIPPYPAGLQQQYQCNERSAIKTISVSFCICSMCLEHTIVRSIGYSLQNPLSPVSLVFRPHHEQPFSLFSLLDDIPDVVSAYSPS